MVLKPQRVRGTTPQPKQCSAFLACTDEVLRSFIRGPRQLTGHNTHCPTACDAQPAGSGAPSQSAPISFTACLPTDTRATVPSLLPADNLQPLLIPLRERSLPAEKIPRTTTQRRSTNGSGLLRFPAPFLWYLSFLKHYGQCTPAFGRVSISATREQRTPFL